MLEKFLHFCSFICRNVEITFRFLLPNPRKIQFQVNTLAFHRQQKPGDITNASIFLFAIEKVNAIQSPYQIHERRNGSCNRRSEFNPKLLRWAYVICNNGYTKWSTLFCLVHLSPTLHSVPLTVSKGFLNKRNVMDFQTFVIEFLSYL